ncbi:hypothetical protein FE257_001365 [Aspergillus nanangensis]|uniref:Gelsolin repeat protein n=1 Tax=Aspergillus nanangensis TaxID=2582783 RepID=A0AAD4CFD8_ASPNN|nr:hypothetical protein FE257_001365 [Aspergillus nanangensis]
MTSTTDAEGSEEVNDFLLRIRELGEKRDKEDEERTKKLEEEILQGRRERQARRAERARSISPTKDSPLLDPVRWSTPTLSHRAIDPPEKLAPTPQTPNQDTSHQSEISADNVSIVTEGSRRGSRPEVNDTESSPRPVTPSLRSRAGTLSWQQRPPSRDLNTNRFSFSTSPTREGRFRAMSTTSNDGRGFSRSPGTQSPVAKETSPLRHIPRDTASPTPAQDVSTEDSPQITPSQDISPNGAETDTETAAESEKGNVNSGIGEEQSRSASRASSTIAESSLGNRYSSVSSVSTATGLGSPMPSSTTQKFEPPKPVPSSDDQATTPVSPRRLSPERSTSPTKGLGGFVQSAMMRRSDSVSKRWSAQLPSGLMRGNSFASNRNSFAAPSNGDLISPPSPTRLSRSGTLSASRPTSSHSEATAVPETINERPVTPTRPGSSSNNNSQDNISRPPLSLHARSTSALGGEQKADISSLHSTSPVVSRTMDPKRWSPTKSTWLESALNRPESPRHKRQPSQQASWARERQSRGSVDLGRVNSFKEVTPVGLMRTAVPGSHTKTPSVSGLADVFGPPDANRNKEEPEESLKVKPEEHHPLASDQKAEEPPKAAELQDSGNLEQADENEQESTEATVSTRKRAPSLLAPSQQMSIDAPLPSPLSPPRDPLLNRPKPQSPVIDFRANLRKREVVKDNSNKNEPEFKNVFGKLRKAETSNYVAPDKLKDNILRGKAALNATGGPKKSQRVDELKESILKQKEAMKANGGSIRRNTVGEDDAPIQDVPEAISKRQNLTKSSSAQSNMSSYSPEEPVISQASQDQQSSLSPQDIEQPKLDLSNQITEERYLDEIDGEKSTPDPFIGNETIQKQERDIEIIPRTMCLEKKTEKSNEENGGGMKPVRALSSESVAQDTKVTAATEGVTAKGKLAGRINPALAGLLSRGPPIPINVSEGSSSMNVSTQKDTNPAEPLTHITKGRARGPKRRPPKIAMSEAEETVLEEDMPQDEPSSPLIDKEPETSISLGEQPMSKSAGWPLPECDISPPAVLAPNLEESSPSAASNPTFITSAAQDTVATKPTEFKTSTNVDRVTPSSVAKLEDVENQRDYQVKKPAPPPKSVPSPSTPARLSQGRSPQPYFSSPSPSPLRTSFRENQTHPSPTPYWKNNNGVATPGSLSSSPRDKALPSPPVPSKFNISVDQSSSPRSSASLVPQADESLEAISGFFKTFPRTSDRVNIDPQLMLMGKNDNQKIRTVRMQIWEITGDGKRQDLPNNQEYILYEGSMYLCVHVFEIDRLVRSEAHLWCGDDVPDAAIDDAQSFSRKVAKDNGCKLETIKQGKETTRFIEALGGILITRRGSSSRSSSSAFFMLCGRKHMGQMVFDEVDFSRRSLCSGYPFVISALFGKLYLWKGKGSAAEEIGAARLIGMDLGLTGEFEEVAEGTEPEAFLEVFTHDGETGNYMGSDYWSLKPNHEHFALRLLRVDHELGQRSGFWLRRSGSASPVIRPNDTVQEVEPFSLKDITARGIYVLDAFFEIYVIVGEQASHRPAEFASAVVFAHEYGILAASLQDRPFIPKSLVSLGGVPDCCRSAFRKWGPRTSRLPPQVFPLAAAIDAIRT